MFEIDPITIALIAGVVVLAIGCVVTYSVGFSSGVKHRKKVAEAELGSAEEKAKSILL